MLTNLLVSCCLYIACGEPALQSCLFKMAFRPLNLLHCRAATNQRSTELHAIIEGASIVMLRTGVGSSVGAVGVGLTVRGQFLPVRGRCGSALLDAFLVWPSRQALAFQCEYQLGTSILDCFMM